MLSIRREIVEVPYIEQTLAFLKRMPSICTLSARICSMLAHKPYNTSSGTNPTTLLENAYQFFTFSNGPKLKEGRSVFGP